MSIQKLHYENLGGMLIRREGLLNWRCPLCKAEGQSREVMCVCPKCRSKETTLPGAQPAPSVPGTHNGMVVGLDYQGAMSCARQRAKQEAGLLYPEGDARKEEKERELTSEYYRQYTTPNPRAPEAKP